MCRAPDHRFLLSAATHTASLWHKMPVRGYQNNFQEPVQIKYVLPKLPPAPAFARIPGSHHPGTRLCLVPEFKGSGSLLKLGQVTQYGNPYLICITHINETWGFHTFLYFRSSGHCIIAVECVFIPGHIISGLLKIGFKREVQDISIIVKYSGWSKNKQIKKGNILSSGDITYLHM